MRILLTGHRGYIGCVAGHMLVSAGYDVVGLDSDLFAGCDFGAAGPVIPEIRKDLRDLEESDLRDFEAVVHFAALSNDPLCPRGRTRQTLLSGELRQDSPRATQLSPAMDCSEGCSGTV
jgi:nucleoside-diphosphate-sugar epimerase